MMKYEKASMKIIFFENSAVFTTRITASTDNGGSNSNDNSPFADWGDN